MKYTRHLVYILLTLSEVEKLKKDGRMVKQGNFIIEEPNTVGERV